jgi:hypothetical protein
MPTLLIRNPRLPVLVVPVNANGGMPHASLPFPDPGRNVGGRDHGRPVCTNRVPTILTTNGFGGSKADQAGLGRAFAERGYAVLSYAGLGFPDSGCKVSLDDPAVDGVAASHLVTFLGGGGSAAFSSSDLAGAPGGAGTLAVDFAALDNAATHDPRVGMIGGSYGGQIQFATAATDSRVDTLCP